MFTPTFRLPWDYIGCETLEQLSEIFLEASNYIKRTDINTPCLFEEDRDELQSQSEPRTGTMGPECC